ncbi:MAG: PQQ-like beta-propeller repeat protein [Phycisphaerae bacterium]|nr:PQQ-like beta-propeller repeat protein [Phycisphaerae bacterium]
MKRTLIFSVVFILVFFFSFSDALGASETYWPTWRGPDMMGISADGNPPLTWSESENVKWKVKLNGDGSDGSPIVWENKIIFQSAIKTDKQPEDAPTAVEEESNSGQGRRGRGGGGAAPTNIYQFNLVCLDRNTGKTLWEKVVCEGKPHQGHHETHGFASFSPVTDGEHIWACFGSRGMFCYDMDGNQIWKQDLGKMTTRFGEGTSPALAGDAVIVTADHEGDSAIYAFDKKTGETLWKKERDEGTSYASPFVVEGYGPLQIVASATGKVRSYDVKTGEVLWECGGQTRNVIPTPVMGFDMVYCTSGFRGSMLQAIKLGQTGDLTGTNAIAWEVKEATPYVPSPLLYGEQIYVLSVNKAIVSCYNAKTGEPYYTKQEMPEIKDVYASPIGAAGRVYFVGRNGVTYVLKNSENFEVLAVNKLDDGIDCSPAIIGDEMYLKSKQYLYCLKASQPASD